MSAYTEGEELSWPPGGDQHVLTSLVELFAISSFTINGFKGQPCPLFYTTQTCWNMTPVLTHCCIHCLPWNIFTFCHLKVSGSPKGAQSHQVSLLVMFRSAGGTSLEQFLWSSPCHREKNCLKSSRHSKPHTLWCNTHFNALIAYLLISAFFHFVPPVNKLNPLLLRLQQVNLNSLDSLDA